MKIPNHIGVILDGNRRWAKENNLLAWDGHIEGVERAKELVALAKNKGIKNLTLFVFSTENWKRSEKEVTFLMKLIEKFFIQEMNESSLLDGVKVLVVGEKEKLSQRIRNVVDAIEEKTKDNNLMTLNIALSYGGRGEIVSAIKKIIKKGIPIDEINEQVMQDNLSIPDLDLIIRTGKEQRISNFFLWQTAYAELYFPNKYWPEFYGNDFEEALVEYDKRKRRFGK